MSEGQGEAKGQTTARARADEPRAAARLGPLPRPLALVILGVWALVTLVALVQLIQLDRASSLWSGALDSLVPEVHRASEGRPLVLLRALPDGLESADGPGDDDPSDPRTILDEAAFAIEEALGEERVPLAPPRTEITRWLDAHALYLLPIETHDALAERLSDARMLAEVQGLDARLTSPLFSVSGEQPRRDPLGVHELAKGEAGRLGHVAEAPGSHGPQVSASGDLIAASGDRALIALRSDRTANELRAELEAAVDGLPVSVALIDPRLSEAALATQLRRDAATAIVACCAGLILALSIVVRRVVPVLVMGLGLASVWVWLAWAGVGLELESLGGLGLGGLGLPSVALSILVLGFGCDAGLRVHELGARGWAGTLVVAGALAPLALSPYPLWQRWALWWALACLAAALIMRLVVPALVELLPSSPADSEWRRRGLRPKPIAALAVLVCVGLSAAGAWAAPQLPYRSAARLPVTELDPHERELIEHFFDPTMIVTASTTPAAPDEQTSFDTPAAAALDAAAETAAQLAVLVPDTARRVDTPGSFVLPRAELEARKQALAKLKLDDRMAALHELLVDQGLRAEAFAEFVRGATDIEDLPSAQAALDGPLGPWISAYLVGEGEEVELRARVELRGHDGLPRAALSAAQLAELPSLRGPAIAAMVDAREFDRRLGVVVVAGLWLTAFLVWLGTGSLGIALAAALVGVACEGGVLLGLSLLGQSTGPHLVPALVLVGAGAGLTGARACRIAARTEAQAGTESGTQSGPGTRPLLLGAACPIIAAAALLSSAQPLWRELGLAVGIGGVLGCGLGLFAAPGLASLFARLRRPAKPEVSS
ncbi:hypothetical protein [Enhygromyxa salina]|uniref:hypothetical protein n=1 Tax=Enhygromyxa salina TaxID=215803 RepID=UPI0015E62580|nr:hypothetical protein [Enhygromyxa salina]